MNIEKDRADFEAGNEVPKGVVYNPNTDWYESIEQSGLPELLRDGPGAYNMKYQGFKEGRAARAEVEAGEAVRYERLHPTQGWIIVEEQDIQHYREQGQQIRPLFTTPQPSEFNAGIEAAADHIRRASIWARADGRSLVADILDEARDEILALRKGVV